MNRRLWKLLWGKIRKKGRADYWRGDTSTIGQRVKLYEHIDRKTVDGKISVNESGMDCDCVRATSGTIQWAIPRRRIESMIDYIYAGAEGPQSVWIDYPAHKATNTSRDLALEAFEDGHPHVVYDPGVSIGDFARDNKDPKDIYS